MLVPNPSIVLNALDIPARQAPTIELWDAWLFAELDAEFALRRWSDAAPGERADAFAVYRAALEREAQAARALQARLAGRRRHAAAWAARERVFTFLYRSWETLRGASPTPFMAFFVYVWLLWTAKALLPAVTGRRAVSSPAR
jgi:hypothetical protein